MLASRLIAHRGCSLLAPENTLAAMSLSKKLGVDWVELDANLMGDGTVVVFHDDRLERLTNGQGMLMDLSVEDLAGLDAGSHFSAAYQGETIPTLEQMLKQLDRDQLGLNLEIKCYPSFTAEQIVLPVIALLERHWTAFERLIISCFETEVLTLIRQHKPDWPLGQLWEELPSDWQTTVEQLNAVSVHLDHTTLTNAQAKAIKQSGLDLYVYTVNDKTTAKRLFDMGVDGIFTDDPTLF
ncbi:glycerophosphoryl diester phosphodiesterase [Nitrincola iocasae]|uniref:Glycerophosphoryl diester phosphodiesterase n=1 Tax=Nitrincola iocasae TaxID=2614693 RepID=A0A5J6LE80_9GAMM|nr:glycerophosphoryl diester phosphodiesterase [Nitrincola iocasae]QEW06743.1 glycerophosphoryl diester phosphodiesterase [Nitrincola iocasae]